MKRDRRMRRSDIDVIGGLRVAYRGDDDIVVVKPAGVSSERPGHAGRRDGEDDSLLGRVCSEPGWNEARLPHRLDRIARGFVLVARDARAAARHSEHIRRSDWTKGYIARVHAPRDEVALVGSHRRYLKRKGQRAECVRAGGDPAILEILAMAPARSDASELHLAIRLVTGRYHQIRAMCADLGAPLVGDELYGGDPRRGEPYLEHAFLRFVDASGAFVTLFDADDRERERVGRRVLDALSALTSAAPAATAPRLRPA